MPRLNKKQKALILKCVERWREDFANTRQPDYDKIKKIIDTAYATQTLTRRVKKVDKRTKAKSFEWVTHRAECKTMHIMQSPLALRIAQAVVRGYVSKTEAAEVCRTYGISAEFLKPLRRDSLLGITANPEQGYWSQSNAMTKVWDDTLGPAVAAAKSIAWGLDDGNDWRTRRLTRMRSKFAGVTPTDTRWLEEQLGRRWSTPVNPDVNIVANNALHLLTDRGPTMPVGNESASVNTFFACGDPTATEIAHLHRVSWSNTAARSTLDRADRVVSTAFTWQHTYSFIEAEALCQFLGVTKAEHLWQFELLHEAHTVMLFKTQALVLATSPTLHTNNEGELHNDEGPAAEWPDGLRIYAIDGHMLGHLGQTIVEKPAELTLLDIHNQQNEEIKRVMIDRYGWSRYLAELNARVIDRRENAVDNTIEMLVDVDEPVRRVSGWRGSEQTIQQTTIRRRRLILSCRSTARQYFLAVPDVTVRSCEEGQRWMAGGANTPATPKLNLPVRVIGAS